MTSHVSLQDATQRSTATFSAAHNSTIIPCLQKARKTGALNLSSRQLLKFPDEIFRLYDDLDEDEHSWECAILKKLDLSYNEITELPSQLEVLRYLVSLRLRHNRLCKIPLSLWSIKSLASLDVSNNNLEGYLPDELGQLSQLRSLELGSNNLAQLPQSIGELNHLEVLHVESNQLKTLPSTIGRLKNLKTLSAHSNQIIELPSSFDLLTELLTLNLKKNCLSNVGNAFIGLDSIKYIDLRQNKLNEFPTLPMRNNSLDQLFLGNNLLREIPESVLRVKNSLTVLDVRDNKLQHLYGKIAELYRLKTLDVTNNDLNDVPPEFGYLKYLNHLLIAGNPLRTIRQTIISGSTETLKKYLRTRGCPPQTVDAMQEEINEISSLRKKMELYEPTDEGEASNLKDEYLYRDASASGKLELIGKSLSQIPKQLCAADKYRFSETLLHLNLSNNMLVELPAAVGDLKSLQTLAAEQCGLTTIHASIAMMSCLQCLRVSKNRLTTNAVNYLLCKGAYASISSSLKEFDLRNNILSEIPQTLQRLKTLDTLLLSFNRIRTLDDFPWSTMHQLSKLSIANNRLESCGSVYHLPKLTSLSLENNELRQIPAELALCENLQTLNLIGNPQRAIRSHILNKGSEAVLNYLRSKLTCDNLKFKCSKEEHACARTSTMPTGAPLSNAIDVEYVRQQRLGSTLNPFEPMLAKENAMTIPDKPLPFVRPQFKSSTIALTTQPQPEPRLGVEPASSGAIQADDKLAELNAKIQELEQSLDDFAISAARRFAIKKDLAMTRSQKIRFLRNLGQKP